MSKMVLPTAKIGPRRGTRAGGPRLISALSRGLRILSVAAARVVQVDSPRMPQFFVAIAQPALRKLVGQ